MLAAEPARVVYALRKPGGRGRDYYSCTLAQWPAIRTGNAGRVVHAYIKGSLT